MSEAKRIKLLFEELYTGDPWLEITIAGTLKNISAKHAAKKFSPEVNSIWEIANHLISWRENVLQRVKSIEIKTPDHNYFLPVKDISEDAWRQTQENLAQSERDWEIFLDHLTEKELDRLYPPNGYSNYKHIHGIIQHDAYHLGQIVMLAKHFVKD